MTEHEWLEYWRPARESGLFDDAEIKVNPTDRARKLKKLLGYSDLLHSKSLLLTDKLRNQLRGLAGPHGAAIKRALEVRK